MTDGHRLAFFGSPDAAVPFLEALVADGWPVELVITRPPARRRRNADPEPSPVGRAAAALGLPVAHDPAAVIESEATLGIVVAYGRILTDDVLDALPLVNVHFSLLPRWRGAAPVERAILAGDTETGVGLMEVTTGLDEGGVYAERRVPIGDRATAAELTDELVSSGVELLRQGLRDGLGEPQPQEGEPTYAAKLTTDDHRIDWHRPVADVDRLVRVGRAWTTRGGRRLRVLDGEPGGPGAGEAAPGTLTDDRVACADGTYRLLEVQPEGKAAAPAADWLRGARPERGERLGT